MALMDAEPTESPIGTAVASGAEISRGTFSATFLLASLKAIETDVVRLETV